jgi:hypothetical protein
MKRFIEVAHACSAGSDGGADRDGRDRRGRV